MIRQKTSTVAIDKTFQKDVEQVGQLLKNLAGQINADAHIQKLAAKSLNTAGKEIIHAEMVFLTEKQDDNAAMQRLKNWVGIKKSLDEGELFSGKISGNVAIEENLLLSIRLYHFDHYPAERLSEVKKTLRIVIYDSSYMVQYKNWHLAEEILARDAAVCLLLNIQPLDEITEDQQLNINGFHTQQLHLGDLGTSITSLFEDETLLHKIKIAKLRNHISDMDKVYRIILRDIESKMQQFRGKAMLNHKKQWQHQQKDSGLSSRDVTTLKTVVNTSLKQLTKAVEQAADDFDKENERYLALEKKIQSFSGFIERKNGKYLTFRMAEGAVQDKVNKANAALKSFFEDTAQTVNRSFQEAETGIKAQFRTWKIASPEQLLPPEEIDPLSEEFLMDSSVASGKSYEKQVPAKGIGSLLMELRTPLFMLMPVMMVYMLFSGLAGGSKEGKISDETSYNNRRCIAVTQLSGSFESQNAFIAALEKKRSNSYFHKEINDGKALILEAQMATVTKEVPKRIGSGMELKEELDLDIDLDNNIIYLYLRDNADREFVIDKLFDPNAKLLAAPSSKGGGGMGMGKIVRAMSNPALKPYKYLILVALVALIAWYITKRKRSMDKELHTSKEREQRKLNEDLRQHLGKNLKQQLQRWKVRIADQLVVRQTVLLQNMENLTNNAIEHHKQKKVQEQTIIQKKTTAIKNEKTLLAAIKSDRRKAESKLGELKTKIARLT